MLMKHAKKLLKACLCIVLIIAMLPAPAFASTVVSRNYRSILHDIGLTDGIIDTLSQEQIEEIVCQYQANPKNVAVTSMVVQFDATEELQAYANASYEEKIQMGLSDQEIQQIDARIADSDIVPLEEGGITAEEMEFSLIVINYSSLTETKYRVQVAFNWLTTYYWDIFQDKIAVAWGGGLLQTKIQSIISYYDLTGDISHNWNSFYVSKSAGYTEEGINAGGYYYFDQSYTPSTSNDYAEAKRGNIEFLLSQTGCHNYSTKVLAQYFHQMLGTQFSLSISVSSVGASISVGITLTGAGDTSPQAQQVIQV